MYIINSYAFPHSHLYNNFIKFANASSNSLYNSLLINKY